MDFRKSVGQAYRDGALVAAEVEVTETTRTQATPVPIAGTSRTDFKRVVIRGPSTIRFVQLDDAGLEDELRQLVAAASDVDLRRRQRDQGWAPKPLNLVLDFERTLTGCVLDHPTFGHSAIRSTDFAVHLPLD